MAKPSDDEKDRECDHKNGDNLTPKTTGEFVLNGGFFSSPSGVFSCGFSSFGCHILIIAHFKEKHKRNQVCYNETMRNNEAFRPTETTEIEKTQEALSRQEKKLVGFYASNGDERFIFDSNLSEFNENRVGEDEEKQAFSLIRSGGEACRKMERQFLHDISRSARF